MGNITMGISPYLIFLGFGCQDVLHKFFIIAILVQDFLDGDVCIIAMCGGRRY
jgi:hypothetical protein